MCQQTKTWVLPFALVAIVLTAGRCTAPETTKTPQDTPGPVTQEPASAPTDEVALEDFVGTWYADAGIKIDLAMKDDGLGGTVTMLGDWPSQNAIAFQVESAVLQDDTLEVRTASMPEFQYTEAFEFHLRVPKDELVCEMAYGPNKNPPMMVSKDAPPESLERFASATLVTAETMSDSRARASCANNLKQLGLVCKMFANEHKGAWPPLADTAGLLMFRMEDIYPEYLTDPNVLICPTVEEEPPEGMVAWFFDDRSYWYLGYAVANEEQGLAFVDAYRRHAETGEGFEDDLTADAGDPIPRLKEGVERFFITDIENPAAGAQAQASVPAIIERPGNHEGGAWVLYMDGHVEFLEYPGRWPMTEAFVQALQSLDELKE